MSLLLDALHRASKDKERAAQAAAAVTASTKSDEGPIQLTSPLELSTDFPTLVSVKEVPLAVEAESPTPAVAASRPIALELEVLPQTVVAVAPESASLALEAPPPNPISVPAPSAPLTAVAAPAKPVVPIAPLAVTGGVSGTSPSVGKIPKISAPDAQAAASAIQGAYVSKPPANARPGMRVLVLGAFAVCLAVGLGSILAGLWGDPEKLFGLTGGSSITAANVPMPAPEAEPVPSAVAIPIVPPVASAAPTPVASAASVVLSTVPAAAPAVVASAPLAIAAVDKPSAPPPKQMALRASPVAPVFTAKVTSQGALEEGYAALLEGRLDDAMRVYSIALDANPLERDALLGLAYIAHTKGRRDEAQAHYAKVLRLEPNNAIANAGMLALGSGINGAGNGERAKELAARQPDSAALQALAANALVQDGLLAEAALAFSRAQELEPTNPWHSYNLAVALDKLGNFAQALNQYQRALSNLGHSSPLRPQQVESARARASQLRQSIATTPGTQK